MRSLFNYVCWLFFKNASKGIFRGTTQVSTATGQTSQTCDGLQAKKLVTHLNKKIVLWQERVYICLACVGIYKRCGDSVPATKGNFCCSFKIEQVFPELYWKWTKHFCSQVGNVHLLTYVKNACFWLYGWFVFVYAMLNKYIPQGFMCISAISRI